MAVKMIRHYRITCDICKAESMEVSGCSNREEALRDVIQSGRFTIRNSLIHCPDCFNDAISELSEVKDDK